MLNLVRRPRRRSHEPERSTVESRVSVSREGVGRSALRTATPLHASLLVALAIVCAGFTAPADAQVEVLHDFVKIESAAVRADGNDHYIDVEAQVEFPTNCKMEFVLTREFIEIQKNMVTVPAGGKIRASFKIENYAPSSAEYIYMTRLLPLDDQPRSVRKEIEGDPETYPPSILPIARYHYDNRFPSGTPETIAAEEARIRKWFVEEYTKLAGLDRKQSAAVKAITDGEEYVDGKGAFDPDKWRKMMDKDIIQVLRDSQKVYNEGLRGERADLLAYRHILADLRILSHAIALRTLDRSIELYKEHGLDPAVEDTKPEEVQTKVPGFSRRIPKTEDLVRMLERIQDKLGMNDEKENAEGGGQ